MKYILLGSMLLITQSFADVSARATPPEDKVRKDSSHYKSKPRKRPRHKYYLLDHDHYFYTNVVSNCDRYLRIIEEKEREIEVLKNQVYRLRGRSQESLQRKLKEEYDLKIKRFDERKSGIGTKSTIRISNEPVKE